MGKIFNRQKGQLGEKQAVKYLKKHGYAILERNFTATTGEIDIIAAKGGYVVFVEVKSRYDTSFGYAAEAVDFQKREKINRTAAVYLKKRMLLDANVRFDVIEVYTGIKEVVHIENAFDSYLRY